MQGNDVRVAKCREDLDFAVQVLLELLVQSLELDRLDGNDLPIVLRSEVYVSVLPASKGYSGGCESATRGHRGLAASCGDGTCMLWCFSGFSNASDW
jgi:hypothetical protein